MFSAMGSRGLMVGTEELPKKDSNHARESSKKTWAGAVLTLGTYHPHVNEAV